MRRKEAMSLGEVLKCLIQEQHLDVKINETKLLSAVDEAFGPYLSSYITKKSIYQKKLFISVNSSVVRNEMVMMRQGMVKVLNEKIGSDVITDIIIR